VNGEPKKKGTPCTHCQSIIAAGLLDCPGCQRLVYADQLNSLAAKAEESTAAGKPLEGLTYWREIIELLPQHSKQHKIVSGKIEKLIQHVDKGKHHNAHSLKKSIPKYLTGLGVAGLFIWKFKLILVFLATKFKLILLGLTKGSTFLTMFLSFGLYWSVWGWKFALGLVLSIYIHEMGHVIALRKYGIHVSAPTFIPGVGAFIRMKQRLVSPIEDARIGLAGPIFGLLTAVICYLVFMATGWGSWGAIAKVGAWINLFNLLPLYPLDGGRCFRSLSPAAKWLACSVILITWLYSSEGLLILLLIIGVLHAFLKSDVKKTDSRALIEYCGLVILLTLLSMVDVPY